MTNRPASRSRATAAQRAGHEEAPSARTRSLPASALLIFGVGLIAGLALALYAPAIFFDALIQKSVLDLFFLTLSLYLLARLVDYPHHLRTWLGLGVAMGALSLTRENALVFVEVILGWVFLR